MLRVDDTAPQRAHANFVDSFVILGERALGGAVIDLGGATAVRTGVPSPEFNRVFLLEAADEPAAVLAEAEAAFGGLPWSLVTLRGPQPGLPGAIRDAGLQFGRSLPAMLIGLPRRPERALDGFAVHAVTTQAEADLSVDILAEAFATDRAFFAVYGEEAVWRAPQTTTLLGWLEGVPVATIAVVVTRGVAGLANLGVLPAARGHGCGEAMSRAAMEAGLRAGADIASLQATRAGFALYKRMGFRHLADYQIWHHPRD